MAKIFREINHKKFDILPYLLIKPYEAKKIEVGETVNDNPEIIDRICIMMENLVKDLNIQKTNYETNIFMIKNIQTSK